MNKKTNRYNVKFEYIKTEKVKASQYEHDKDSFVKHKLSERTKTVGKKLVQRDLYSAYIIKNVEDLENINKNKCKKDFKKFIKNQDLEFKRIRKQNIKNKNFGI